MGVSVWVSHGILRRSVIERVVGGMACVFALLIRAFFSGSESFDQVGAVIDFDDGPEIFYAKTANVLADKDALQDVFGLKGASGYSPCPRCDGLMIGALEDPQFPKARASTSVEINNLTKASFVKTTQTAINSMCDELATNHREVQRKRLTKEAFEAMEMVCGITYNPSSVLFGKANRRRCPLLAVYTDDWAHSYLAKGVGGDELLLLVNKLRGCGVRYQDLREEMQSYIWPRQSVQGRYAWNVFNDKRAQSNKDGWKSSMSEFLYVCPIVLQFAQARFSKRLAGEIESFRRLLAVLDYILAMKKGHVASTETLDNLVESHFEKHVEVYGNACAKPKWHSMLHEGDQIDRDEGLVLDTMANERGNKVPKSFGDTIQKMEDFERIILSRSIAHQIAHLKKFKEYPHLLGADIMWKEDLGAWISHSLSCNGMKIGRGDIVRNLQGEYLNVLACGQTDESLFVVGDELNVTDESDTCTIVQRFTLH